MVVEKGSLVYTIGWFFVVVKETRKGFNCICDNANNIYYWEYDQSVVIPLSFLKQRQDVKLLCENLKREIPWDVIQEVLDGEHNGRFNHWHELKK